MNNVKKFFTRPIIEDVEGYECSHFRILAMAALGKLTELVFEKPGKKLFRT